MIWASLCLKLALRKERMPIMLELDVAVKVLRESYRSHLTQHFSNFQVLQLYFGHLQYFFLVQEAIFSFGGHSGANHSFELRKERLPFPGLSLQGIAPSLTPNVLRHSSIAFLICGYTILLVR